MAIIEETRFVYDFVGDFLHLEIKKSDYVFDGEKCISKINHRRVLAPNSDVSEESQEIQDICNIFWTQEIKDSYIVLIASQEV